MQETFLPSLHEEAHQQRDIFLIGPGGVGKSTVGRHLAVLLARPFVDLDQHFLAEHGDIGTYIRAHGYPQYAEQNARIFFRLIDSQPMPSVWALSSGLLATDLPLDRIIFNRKLVAAHGIAVLLLPSQDRHEAMQIVVARQLARGFGLQAEREREKFLSRIDNYSAMADITIYSQQTPDVIAHDIVLQLNKPNSDVCKNYNQTI